MLKIQSAKSKRTNNTFIIGWFVTVSQEVQTLVLPRDSQNWTGKENKLKSTRTQAVLQMPRKIVNFPAWTQIQEIRGHNGKQLNGQEREREDKYGNWKTGEAGQDQ